MASYAEVMKALAAIYRASDETVRGALRGRVQNLQKFGVPIDVGAQTGRGRKIDYGREEIYQIVFCLELYERPAASACGANRKGMLALGTRRRIQKRVATAKRHRSDCGC